MEDNEFFCSWCGQRFERAHGRGPRPKYCCPAHRQRAHQARRRGAGTEAAADTAGLDVTSSMATVLEGLDVTSSMTKMLQEMDAARAASMTTVLEGLDVTSSMTKMLQEMDVTSSMTKMLQEMDAARAAQAKVTQEETAPEGDGKDAEASALGVGDASVVAGSDEERLILLLLAIAVYE